MCSWNEAVSPRAFWVTVTRCTRQHEIQNCYFSVQPIAFGRDQNVPNNETRVPGKYFIVERFHFFFWVLRERNHVTVPAVLAARRFNLWDSGEPKHGSLSLFFCKHTPDYSFSLPTTGQIEGIEHASMQWQSVDIDFSYDSDIVKTECFLEECFAGSWSVRCCSYWRDINRFFRIVFIGLVWVSFYWIAHVVIGDLSRVPQSYCQLLNHTEDIGASQTFTSDTETKSCDCTSLLC